MDTSKQATIQDNLEPTKETIAKLIVGPTMLHTELTMLVYSIQMNQKILLLDAIECQMRFEEEIPENVALITIDYKIGYMVLTKELHVEAPKLPIMHLVP